MADSKISALSAITSLLSTDEFVVARAGTTKKIAAQYMGGWELSVDLPLTTGTDWGMPAGYSTDGTKHIVGTNAQARNWYTPHVRQDFTVYEAEFQLPSTSRSASEMRLGFMIGHSATTGNQAIFVRWNALASAQIYVEIEGITAGPSYTIPGGLATDTWHKLRVVKAGLFVSVFVNGTFHRSFRVDTNATPAISSVFGFYAYQIDGYYRNLKIWNMALPV